MANQQSQIVTIDGVEFKVEDMTEQQQMLLNHVADLERKIGSTKFQAPVLVGKSPNTCRIALVSSTVKVSVMSCIFVS